MLTKQTIVILGTKKLIRQNTCNEKQIDLLNPNIGRMISSRN